MRYGCRRCGIPLPAVQAGEMLRVRCAQRGCGFVNVIPADPNLAPWEARGAVKLLVVDDPEGAVLLAPPIYKARTHQLLITSCPAAGVNRDRCQSNDPTIDHHPLRGA